MTDETPISASVLSNPESLRQYVNARIVEGLNAEMAGWDAQREHDVFYGDGSAQPLGILNAKPPAQPKIRQGARKAEMRRRGR